MHRRKLLKALGCSPFVITAAAMEVAPALAAQTPAGDARRTRFMRLPLSNGFILHAGETSMELYHRHPHDPREEVVQPEDIRLQTRLVMRNHKEVLDWMGLDWRNVVKLTRYQKRMDESAAIDQVLNSYFKDWQPPQTTYLIDGLSSPQARVEIDMWVLPPQGTPEATPGPVRGIASIFPRPEVTDRMAYAPGIKVPREMDLLFFSGLTAYPWDVDPWQQPGRFTVPSDPAARSALATANLEQVLTAAGIGWQHIINNVNYAAPGGGTVNFRERWGTYSPCSTSLRVTEVGIPGINVLNELNAAAPRKPIGAVRGMAPGIEPILHRPDAVLKDLPGAPAIRVSSDVDLVFFPGVTGADEQALAENIDRQLKAAGLTWNHIVLMTVTGQMGDGRALKARLGDWRPCRSVRAVSTGIPGAAVMCEVTAVAPRTR